MKKTPTPPTHILTDSSLTVMVKGTIATFVKGDGRFEKAVQLFREKEFDKVEELFDVSKPIMRYTHGRVQVADSCIYFNGEIVYATVADRILKFLKEDLPYQPLVHYLDDVMQNPNPEARLDLFDFIEANNVPLTPDGCFLGYKGVRENYESFHANTDGSYNRNMVGDKNSLPREDCCSDRNVTCAPGLHICGYNYKLYYNSPHVMICKIHPKNVVSVPLDYGRSKMRCCEFEVVAEHMTQSENVLNGSLFVATKDKVMKYNVRDKKGRFSRFNRDALGRFKRVPRKFKKKLKAKTK